MCGLTYYRTCPFHLAEEAMHFLFVLCVDAICVTIALRVDRSWGVDHAHETVQSMSMRLRFAFGIWTAQVQDSTIIVRSSLIVSIIHL